MIWAAITFGVFAFWKWYSALLLPFVGAFVLSVWLAPWVTRLQAWGFSRSIAAFTALISWVAVIFLSFILLLTVIYTELSQLARHVPRALPFLERSFQQILVSFGRWQRSSMINARFWQGQMGSITRLLQSVLHALANFLVHLPDDMLMLVVALVAAFFLLRDKERMIEAARKWVPPPMRPYMHHVHDDILAGSLGFIKAQILLVSLTALTTTVGLLIFGFRYAVLLGVIAGLLDFVPYLGPTTLLIPWALVLFVNGHSVTGCEVLVILLGVALVRQLAEPRLVGQKMGLHPLVAIAAMYFGAHFFGAAGFVVGPISALVIKVLGEVLDPPSTDLPR